MLALMPTNARPTYDSALFDLSKRVEVKPKALARYLYEVKGLSLIDISKELDINHNTLKGWRRKDNWIPCKEEQLRGHNPNSLKNLELGHPYFEVGNKEAVTHGFYADISDDPLYWVFFDRAMQLNVHESLKFKVAHCYAHLYTWEERRGRNTPMNIPELLLSCIETNKLLNLINRSLKIQGQELDARLKALKTQN